MKLSKEEIIKLARLGRLKLSDDEITQYQTELSGILDYVAQLESVDIDDLEPTYQVTGLTSQDNNATREDKVDGQVPHEQLLKNLPDHQDGHIKVKG